jgi:hypothetical protein
MLAFGHRFVGLIVVLPLDVVIAVRFRFAPRRLSPLCTGEKPV